MLETFKISKVFVILWICDLFKRLSSKSAVLKILLSNKFVLISILAWKKAMFEKIALFVQKIKLNKINFFQVIYRNKGYFEIFTLHHLIDSSCHCCSYTKIEWTPPISMKFFLWEFSVHLLLYGFIWADIQLAIC